MDELETRFVGRVYRIWSPDTNLVYIGSTRKTLEHRFSEHKRAMRKWQRGKTHYYSSYEILKYEDAQIELVQEDYFGDTLQLREMEKYWVEKSNAVNKYAPLRTQEELREYNRKRNHNEKRREYHRKREQTEKRCMQHKQWATKQVQCPICGKLLRRDSIPKHNRNMHSTSV